MATKRARPKKAAKKSGSGRARGEGASPAPDPVEDWQVEAKKQYDERQRKLRRQERAEKKAEKERQARLAKERAAKKAERGREKFEARFRPKKPRKKTPPKAPAKPRVRESYQDRIARLMSQGFSKSEARGHARKVEGELGVQYDRKLAVAVVRARDEEERHFLRRQLLARFQIANFEAEAEFVGVRIVQDDLYGPFDWHKRRRLYQKIAEHLNRFFSVTKNETFSLLFSP